MSDFTPTPPSGHAEQNGEPVTPCTLIEQERFMERLGRNDLRVASLEAKVDSALAMLERTITRRREDRSVRHLG